MNCYLVGVILLLVAASASAEDKKPAASTAAAAKTDASSTNNDVSPAKHGMFYNFFMKSKVGAFILFFFSKLLLTIPMRLPAWPLKTISKVFVELFEGKFQKIPLFFFVMANRVLNAARRIDNVNWEQVKNPKGEAVQKYEAGLVDQYKNNGKKKA